LPGKFATRNETMKINSSRPRLVIAVNSSIALGFLQGQPEYFQNSGFDVTVLCPEKRSGEWEVARPDGVRVLEVPMEREISPMRDIRSAWHLWGILRSLRPTVTNVGTPKAGLLGGFAAWLTRVPCRFYTLHGLRFETTTGFKRKLLIYAERLACRFAHRVVCVSHSVRKKAIASGLVDRDRALIFGAGSCNGVDVARFAPTPQRMRRAADLRHQFRIPADAPVVLFVGRLTCDKGVAELMEAFLQLEIRFPKLRLLLVGSFEDGDPLPADIRQRLESHERVILAGPVNDPAPYYAVANVLVLPSHREGLPTVVLEGHAAGKPVIGAAATGIVDLLADGETGLLFPVGDVSALAEAIARLVDDKALARKLALAGQELVKRKFRQELIWAALRREYLKVLQGAETPHSSVLPQHEN
jgi:glycosyltransferase involved in cell wall biosynthesis